MKRLSLLLCAILIVVSASGCAVQISPSAIPKNGHLPDYTFEYYELNTDGNPSAITGQFFAEEVGKLSGGRITVNVNLDTVIPDESDAYQKLADGEWDFFRGGAMSMSGDLEISNLALPYIFRDGEHQWSVLQSDFGQDMLKAVGESGVGYQALCYVYEGARNFLTTCPVNSVEDMANLTIRGKPGVVNEILEIFGATVKEVPYSELYTALETGDVDGAEQPIIGYRSEKLYEVAPYFVLDHHTYNPGIILMSDEAWNSLDEDAQRIITEAAKSSEDFSRMTAMNLEQATLAELKDKGAVITEVADISPWQDAAESILEAHLSGFPDFLDKIHSIS